MEPPPHPSSLQNMVPIFKGDAHLWPPLVHQYGSILLHPPKWTIPLRLYFPDPTRQVQIVKEESTKGRGPDKLLERLWLRPPLTSWYANVHLNYNIAQIDGCTQQTLTPVRSPSGMWQLKITKRKGRSLTTMAQNLQSFNQWDGCVWVKA